MSGPADLRAPIADSWRRAYLAGLEPGSALDGLSHAEIDLASPLLSAAAPVLEDLNFRLVDTSFSTLLVDREGRVAQRWCGTHGAARAFDHLGVEVGASMLEEAVGTNAPGTVLETRASISVNGSEHFAVPLRQYSCYGHPIFHPVTRRIEGVLDITFPVEDASPLLQPLIGRAVADIEQRLLDGSRVSERELLRAFQGASGRRRAVVAVGDALVMSNQAALDLLGSVDMAMLRMLAQDVGRAGLSRDITLESGAPARVHVEEVPRTHGAALVYVDPLARPRSPRNRTLGTSAATTGPVLVAGPPGSGRTTRARSVAGDQPLTVLTASSALLDGTQAWSRDLAAVLRSRQGTLCVDGIDLMPENLLDLVRAHLATGKAPRLILISGPADGLTGRAAALAAQCADRIELAPLSTRLTELPDLVTAMFGDLDRQGSRHLAPNALRALAAHPWPGNLRELRAVIEYAARSRSVGAVTVDDLPERYRTCEAGHSLAPMQRAEHDVIVAALREHDGNKVRAAAALGISRTTLYARMRSLRITSY